MSRIPSTAILAAVAIGAAGFAFIADGYLLYVGTLIAVYAIAALGLGLIVGLFREVSIGHGVFFACGAYGFALLQDVPLIGGWSAMPIVVVLSAVLGGGFGMLTCRLSGAQFALASLCLAVIGHQLAIELKPLTGGFGGIATAPIGQGAPAKALFVGSLMALCLGTLATRNLFLSRWGRALSALGDDQIAAASAGLGKNRLFPIAMALSAAITAIAGLLFAPLVGYISPENFAPHLSIVILIAVLFGGARHPLGALLGSAAAIGIPEIANDYSDFRLILYGAILLTTIYFLPNGLAPLLFGSARFSEPGSPQKESHGIKVDRKLSLRFERLTVRYDGNTALQDVSGSIEAGTVTCLLGPNGAGKTTLLNALSGFGPEPDGRMALNDKWLETHSPDGMAREGIARTFQQPKHFQSLSVSANVSVGLAGHRLFSPIGSLTLTDQRAADEQAMAGDASALLGELKFSGDAQTGPASCNFADWRKIDLARCLAQRPGVVLLDEPTSGLDRADVEWLADTIRSASSLGIALLVVTHDVHFAMRIAHSIMILDCGKVVYTGSPSLEAIETHIGAVRAESKRDNNR